MQQVNKYLDYSEHLPGDESIAVRRIDRPNKNLS